MQQKNGGLCNKTKASDNSAGADIAMGSPVLRWIDSSNKKRAQFNI